VKSLAEFNRVQVILALAAVAFLPTALWAQEQGEDQPAVTLQEVKDRLKENKKFLEEARTRGKAGDAPGLQVALDNYNRGMEGLDKALRQDQFEGDEFASVDALERVEKATRKHGEILADLLNKVPEQAKPAIEGAMEVSQRGRTTALAKLANARAQRDAARVRHEQAGQMGAGNRPATAGPPSGVGQPGGVGGPPSGVGQPAKAGPPSGKPGPH